MTARRDVRVYLQDMAEYAALAEAFLDGVDRERFLVDPKTQLAVLKAIETVGEAAKHIPDDLRSRFPAVPWRQIAGFRDHAVHAYFTIDLTVVWKIAQNDLPPLRTQIAAILAELDREMPRP